MVPDITIRDYYLNYIHTIKNNIVECNNKIKEYVKIRDTIYQYLYNKQDDIKNNLKINLNNYKEWTNKIYTKEESLFNKIYKDINNKKNKELIINIIKYCKSLYNINKYEQLMFLNIKNKDITYKDYRKYVAMYYNKVHQCVLEGNRYKFNYGIGVYLINRKKITNPNIKKVDYNATNLKKKEIIAQGKKPYDEKEAIWYKSRNIPYDGIPYVVFKNEDYIYDIKFINSTIIPKNAIEYQRTEYVVSKYRGLSYKDIGDKFCKTKEDIYNLQVDIKYKLNILLYKYPMSYLNFVR